MNKEEIDRILAATLEDQRLSRGERLALRQVFEDEGLNEEDRAFWRHRAFALARDAVSGEARRVLEWVEEIVKALVPAPAIEHEIDVHFSPGDTCRRCIGRLFDEARKSADVCVFTITDDLLVGPILRAHERGVTVRIVTDDDKTYDIGSDIDRLRAAGIPVRFDGSEHHMHHKYAIFDGHTLLTGSYNWTRSAAAHNRENVIVSRDPRLVRPFLRNFAELWEAFGPNVAV